MRRPGRRRGRGAGDRGWITGVARALKAYDRAIRAFAVEPAESPLISEQRWGTHGVGIGDGIVPHNLDLSLMDGIVTASTDEALEMAHRLAREEGSSPDRRVGSTWPRR